MSRWCARLLVAMFLSLCGSSAALADSEPIRAAAPEIFAPDAISGPANDGAPAFSPDGNTLYFGRSGGRWGFIMESHRVRGKWTEPSVASFSGLWPDSQPALSPDGSRLVFQSLRPATVDPAKLATAKTWGPSALWEVMRTATGWSEAVRLPDTVNISQSVWRPSLAADGMLYFMTKAAEDKTWRLYRSAFREGRYQQAEPLSFSTGASTDVDPEIAPDQSFLIFSSASRAASDDAHEHLYITFRQGAAWGPIVPLRYEDDYEKNPTDDGEARLGRDGRTLYFTSGRFVHVHPNRTRAQAAEDFRRVTSWDDSNNNVWTITLLPWLSGRAM